MNASILSTGVFANQNIVCKLALWFMIKGVRSTDVP